MNIGMSRLITKTQTARGVAFAALADLRWQRETGGLALPDGRQAQTSREARALLNSTVAALQAGLITAPVAWKLASGWEQMTAEQLTGLAAAVQSHVTRCFVAEQAVAEKMTALPGDLGGFDIETAFDAAFQALSVPGP